ncbi:MAG TPA: hypothetical protein VFO46_25995 [Candidatus Sulfotelmatobacter sp.]|nr:hypothetical protein [Candidatus Sulfotelmatobacter sp.]
MEYPSFFPETALALLHALVYGMACVLVGASLIGLSVYIALLCSEMFSQPRSKAPRAKVPQLAHRALVAEESHDLSAVEKRIFAAPNRLAEEGVRVTAPANGQVPMTIPATLESEPTWS